MSLGRKLLLYLDYKFSSFLILMHYLAVPLALYFIFLLIVGQISFSRLLFSLIELVFFYNWGASKLQDRKILAQALHKQRVLYGKLFRVFLAFFFAFAPLFPVVSYAEEIMRQSEEQNTSVTILSSDSNASSVVGNEQLSPIEISNRERENILRKMNVYDECRLEYKGYFPNECKVFIDCMNSSRETAFRECVAPSPYDNEIYAINFEPPKKDGLEESVDKMYASFDRNGLSIIKLFQLPKKADGKTPVFFENYDTSAVTYGDSANTILDAIFIGSIGAGSVLKLARFMPSVKASKPFATNMLEKTGFDLYKTDMLTGDAILKGVTSESFETGKSWRVLLEASESEEGVQLIELGVKRMSPAERDVLSKNLYRIGNDIRDYDSFLSKNAKAVNYSDEFIAREEIKVLQGKQTLNNLQKYIADVQVEEAEFSSIQKAWTEIRESHFVKENFGNIEKQVTLEDEIEFFSSKIGVEETIETLQERAVRKDLDSLYSSSGVDFNDLPPD